MNNEPNWDLRKARARAWLRREKGKREAWHNGYPFDREPEADQDDEAEPAEAEQSA